MSVWSPASWVYIVVTYYRDDLLDLGGVPAIVVGRLLEADLSCWQWHASWLLGFGSAVVDV